MLMHRYNPPNQGYHGWHQDWAVHRPDFSRRLLVGMIYLNDVEEGGETGFLIKEDGEYIKVKPKTGTLIIHPASWPFIHKGYMPLSSDKYILTTWLCWKDLSQEQNPLFIN